MAASVSTVSNGATLLVVDDDARARRNLRRILEAAGHRAIAAADAPSALSLLHREHCDLVVLDVEMPGLGGLALCRLLRAQPATKQLPVIMLSAVDDEDRKVEAFAAGADDYIVKPSNRRELLSRIQSHLQGAQREWSLVGSNRELRFLADLGRGLLRAIAPEQVVRHVAGATFEGTDADLCAAIIFDNERQAICSFDREGIAEENDLLLWPGILDAWRHSPAASASARLEDPGTFFLRDQAHRVEYAAPLRYGGRTKGVLVVGFDKPEQCTDDTARLVDAAAQQAALAAHVASLHQAARESSVTLANEVARQTAEIEAQRRFTEAIIDNLPVSLYVIDRDFRVVAWNRNRELGGQGIPRGLAIGRSVFDVLTRQKREVLEAEFRRAFTTGEISYIEQETKTPDGENRHWLISKIPMRAAPDGTVSHVITVGEDITERVEASRAVARAERLSSVGRLAAGVVHEINNPLATMSACAEALESRVDEGAFDDSPEVGDLREYLGLIRSEAFRCKTITNGLLDFSRTRAGQWARVDPGDLLRSTARLVGHQQRGERITIDVIADENVPAVMGDEGQLQQAIIALATNAIDAMPEGGRLTLRARQEEAHILIEVSDTGTGISIENLTRIFDPFFTTKEVGRGTGLGLAVCYGIVSEHRGRLDVESVLGSGTKFTITLPVATTSSPAAPGRVNRHGDEIV